VPLPPPPVITTDLAEADLPLRPLEREMPAADAPSKPADKLSIPVEGIKLSQLSDNFDQPRGKERHHEALDIMAPKGTKVLATADGKVVKLFNSKPGGLTVYQFDPTEKFAYYYAHLDRYADGVKEGSVLKRGDLVGYVGVTGNANPNAPHLHFAVFELTPTKEWWKGTPLNPYPMLGE
jgi:murein DD-endopeptidase MepM/ murein hydrolase activator NlpD